MQSGYYSMQCICGWWHPSNLKPQSQWTDDDYKEQVKHQQFHLNQQAYANSKKAIETSGLDNIPVDEEKRNAGLANAGQSLGRE